MITVEIENDNGEVSEYDLPSIMKVCHNCEGHGYVLCHGMRNACYSAEEFEEEFSDEDKEEYFRVGGKYDIKCPTCNGKNVVQAIDRSSCIGDLADILKLWDKQEMERAKADREYEAECRMERLMGC